jgi:lauroyl/myristoyl acyltransferase
MQQTTKKELLPVYNDQQRRVITCLQESGIITCLQHATNKELLPVYNKQQREMITSLQKTTTRNYYLSVDR